MISFDELGLKPQVLSAIHELGFVQPTLIQEQTIPFLLNSDQDLVALAQTGTGKTAAFGLPIINEFDVDMSMPQALILSPTRELALQIASDLNSFSKHLKGSKIAVLYGGSDIKKQMSALEKGAQIVVGTPGRTLDLMKRGKLRIQQIRWLVLDEADEMLSMGFKEDLDAILAETPQEKQTLLFSATMPAEIEMISRKYMTAPKEITVGRTNQAAENVEHHYYLVHAKDRYLALKRIADINPNIYAIIFCRTRAETKEVADKLMKDGYNADALHGDLSQAQRDYVMGRFRARHLQMLVATDVAARGLDVNDLTHVINYNLPDDPEVYIHRSGRTGRAGKKGISITLIHLREKGKLRSVEAKMGKKFQKMAVPTGREICEKQLFSLIDRMEKVEVNEEQIAPFMPVIYKKLAWLDREALIKHFVSVEFNRFLQYYENAEDINVNESYERESRSGRDRKGRDGRRVGDRGRNRAKRGEMSRFFLNIGKKKGLNKRGVLDLINQNTRGKSIEVGNIEVLKGYSFFEIDARYSKDIVKAFKNAQFKGSRINIEPASKK